MRSGKRKKLNKVEKPIPSHPIATAIEKFLRRARDFESAVTIHVPLSVERKRDLFKELVSKIEDGFKFLNGSSTTETAVLTKILDSARRIDRLQKSNVPDMLRISIFLGLFSAYDAFTGDLLRAIYSKRPELLNKLTQTVTVSSLLQFSSFEDLRSSILEEEIDRFRRASYIEQFSELHKSFDIPLKDFNRWANFVECSQRRNILTHNDGIVNAQYLKICGHEGYAQNPMPLVGERLDLDMSYLIGACELLMEVSLKLAQTLWRKLFPDEIDSANNHLNQVIYEDCLMVENWKMAIVFGEFAVSQKKSTDQYRKLFTINNAIGLKFSGKQGEAEKLLSSVDWSGSSSDFKLAIAVLNDDFGKATELMTRIGISGDMINEHAYYQFPVFREFRKSDEFRSAFENVFGKPFTDVLQEQASKEQAIAKEEIEKQDKLVDASDIKESDTTNELGKPRKSSNPNRGRTSTRRIKD